MATERRRKRCAAQHFGAWAVEPQWFASAITEVRAGRWKAYDDSDDDSPPPTQAESVYEMVGNIAVISISGQMTKGGSSFGGCSMLDVRRLVRAAVSDWRVQGIMLHIDSPGGTVDGTADLARDISDARKIKAVWSYCDGMACSAAYWAASQTAKIWCNTTSLVGCIGTYTVLTDSTGAQDKLGITYKVISEGRFKGLGADGKVTDDLVSDVKREVAEFNAPFLADVMAGRGKGQDWMDVVSDGRAYVGVNAESLGLVDAVASFDAAMSALAQEISHMDPIEDFKTAYPDAVKALRDEGYAAGLEAGSKAGIADAVKAERDRLQSLATAFPGRSDFVLQQAAAGNDIATAKAALADVLAKENEALKAAAEKAAASVGAAPVQFVAGELTELADKDGLTSRQRDLLKMSGAGRAALERAK